MAYDNEEKNFGTYNQREESEIQLKLITNKTGNCFLDLRNCWTPTGEGEMRPTKKGVRLPVEALKQLIEDLQTMDKELEGKNK